MTCLLLECEDEQDKYGKVQCALSMLYKWQCNMPGAMWHPLSNLKLQNYRLLDGIYQTKQQWADAIIPMCHATILISFLGLFMWLPPPPWDKAFSQLSSFQMHCVPQLSGEGGAVLIQHIWKASAGGKLILCCICLCGHSGSPRLRGASSPKLASEKMMQLAITFPWNSVPRGSLAFMASTWALHRECSLALYLGGICVQD